MIDLLAIILLYVAILLLVEKYFSDSVSCVEGALLISLRCCD